VAVQLLKAGRPLRIVVVEPRPQLGPGLAYSTSCAGHLMNVPSGKLSLADDDPKHFVKWLRTNYNDRGDDYSFAPRLVYGRYVSALLEAACDQARPGVSFEHVRSEAIALDKEGSRFCLRLRDGSTVEADAVVLALGNPPPSEEAIPAVQGSAFQSSPCYFRSAWDPGAASSLEPEAPVLLVGSGLTAVDTAIALHEQGHRGVIHIVSRRGLLPRSHALSAPPNRGGWKLEVSTSLRELCPKVRKQIRVAETRGEDWRGVIDGLRADTPRLWQGLPCAERRRFLRHLRPYWDVHRHRMAPEVSAFIDGSLREGRLKLHAGRIRKILATADGAQAQIKPRGRSEELVLAVRRVINCTGPDFDLRKLQHPFWKDLFDKGTVDSGPMGLGLKTTADGELISARGEVATNFLTLGPARMGSDWETIAIPEIRAQATALASRLLGTARLARERTGVAAPDAEPHAEPAGDLVGAARDEGRRQYL
jgi:uncharacterized NAD(P)/FAD-binding protein YdhS